MGGLRRLPRWLRVGLLLGSPMALGVFTTLMIGDRLQNCRATGLTTVAPWTLMTILVTGAAGAGWWASQGVRDRYGCLAGLVLGLLVAAGLIAAGVVDLALHVSCLTTDLPEDLRPQITSILTQSAVSSALELVGLAGLVGLVAAIYRRHQG
jgi:hypothetical protein